MKNDDTLFKILSPGEEILMEQKPHKPRFVFDYLFMSLLLTFWIVALTISVLLIFDVNKNFLFLPLVLFLLDLGVSMPLSLVAYKNTIYVLTNKRIIVKTGTLSTRYNSIELSQVEMIDLKFDLFDKIFGASSGTISFCGHLLVNGQADFKRFSFKFLKEPQQVYIKIEKILEQNKKQGA